MKKAYLVQSWTKEGALENNYEVSIESERELAELKKFLKSKFGHVLVAPVKKTLKPAGESPFSKGRRKK